MRQKTKVFNEQGIEICGAKTRRGAVCQQTIISADNGRCRMHGGGSPRGIAASNYKDGRYSRYLPARLAQKYQEALADDDLLALRDEIGLLDARIGDLLLKLDGGESGATWRRLAEVYSALQDALAKRDGPNTMEALTSLSSLIERGLGEESVWREIVGTLEARRRLTDSERRRLVDAEQFITAERATLLIGGVLEIIRRNISDRSVLQAIAEDVRDLMSVEGQNGK